MLLTTEGLAKRYVRKGVAVDALKDVNLEIPDNAFVSVTGPSGSGKTTLLLTLAGLLKPTGGKIRYGEQQLEGFSDAEWAAFRHQNLGFVMQNFSLVPYLTAEENVTLPMAIAGASRSEQRGRALSLLDRIGLADRANHLPRELSAGQQQRVAIARALANDPGLVLADEPTGNLDPALAQDVLALLKKFNEESGTAILMVTHSPEAARVGTYHVRIDDGCVVNAATTASV
jgi:ABC-type lipoprotein export system ATPase subunit